MAWTATFRSNPTDPHPVTFSWDDGRVTASEPSMLRALERVAEDLGEVGATATGPFLPADLSVPHAAFSVLMHLARRAGLEPGDVEVRGDGWQWPTAVSPYATTDAAQTDVVY